MTRINLLERQEIKGYWTIKTKTASFDNIFGTLHYELGKTTIVKFFAKSECKLIEFFGGKDRKLISLSGITQLGACYCINSFVSSLTYNTEIAEFQCHANFVFFVEELQPTEGECPLSEINSLEYNYFTKCNFSLSHVDNIFSRCLALALKGESKETGVFSHQKISNLELQKYPLELEDVTLTLGLSTSYAVRLFGDETKSSKIYFSFDTNGKNIQDILYIIHRIKTSFSFLCNRQIRIEELTLNRENEQKTYIQNKVIMHQKNVHSNGGGVYLEITSLDTFKRVFESLHSICSIKSYKLFSALNDFDHTEVHNSIALIAKAIDENYNLLIDLAEFKTENEELCKKLKSAIDYSKLEDGEIKQLNDAIEFFKHIGLRKKITEVFRQAKNKYFSPLSQKVIKSYTNLICEIRVNESHGRISSSSYNSEKDIQKVIHANFKLYIAVYIQLLKKIGLDEHYIANFCLNSLGVRKEDN